MKVTDNVSAIVCTQGAYAGTKFPQGLDTIAVTAERGGDLASQVLDMMEDAFIASGYDGDVIDIVSQELSFPDKAAELGVSDCEVSNGAERPCGTCARCLDAIGNWFVEYTMNDGGDRLYLTDDDEVYWLTAQG